MPQGGDTVFDLTLTEVDDLLRRHGPYRVMRLAAGSTSVIAECVSQEAQMAAFRLLGGQARLPAPQPPPKSVLIGTIYGALRSVRANNNSSHVAPASVEATVAMPVGPYGVEMNVSTEASYSELRDLMLAGWRVKATFELVREDPSP